MITFFTAFFALLGAFFILMAAVGVIRMPDTYLRMSVATKSTTLGVSFCLVAFGIYFHQEMTTMRVLIIILFVMITAPVSAHLIGRAIYIDKHELWEKSLCDDLKDQYDENNEIISSEKTSK